jgi:hypothetical protein
MPFQFTQTVPAFASQQGSDQLKARLTKLVSAVPAGRFAVIESVALKGTHPANTYLALELQTGLRTLDGRGSFARHFLYQRVTGIAPVPIELRETTHLYADTNSPINFGMQASAAANIQPLAITIVTGRNSSRRSEQFFSD